VLDQDAMQELIARPSGGVASWCADRGVAEDALELVIRTYGRDEMSAAAVVEAFRLGYDSAESQGGSSRQRGEISPGPSQS
jgi:hypothetical protein